MMEWTKRSPTASGWYWLRESHPESEALAQIVLVQWADDFDRVVFIYGRTALKRDVRGEWAGPIEEPS